MKNINYYNTVKYDNFNKMIEAMNASYSETIAIKYFEKNKIKEMSYSEVVEEISSIYNYLKTNKIDNLNKDSIVVLELSSHQLEYVKSSVNIAILLNIFEEHLDHYKSYNHYIDAKLNICKYQNENDYLLYNIDVVIV